MTATAKPDQLLFRFRPADSGNGISRATLARLAEYLGLTETQAMHYASSWRRSGRPSRKAA